MTTYKGNSGVVKVGAGPTAVAEVVSFNVTEQVGTVEDTALGDTARTHVSDDLVDWSGSITCHHFPTDSNGQAALTVGTSIAVELYPIGTTTGREKLSGTAIVTNRQVGDVANAAIVPITIQLKGTGALTHGTAS